MDTFLKAKSKLALAIVSVCAVITLIFAGAAYALSMRIIELPASDIEAGNGVDFEAGVVLYYTPWVDNCVIDKNNSGDFIWKDTAVASNHGAFCLPVYDGRHTVYGPAKVTWPNIGLDSDGDKFDIVLTLDWMDVTTWGESNAYGLDADPDWGWCVSSFSGVTVHQAQLTYHFYKHGTTNHASGVFINGYKDIDIPGDPSESVQFVNGLARAGLSQITGYVGSDYESHMSYNAGTATFTGLANDHESFNSGVLVAFDTSQDVTIYWKGSGCGTELFKTYLQYNVNLRENMNVGYLTPTSTRPVASQEVYSNGTVKVPFNNRSTYKGVVEDTHYHIASITGADTNYTNTLTDRIQRNNLHEATASLNKLTTDRTVTVNFEPDIYELTFNMHGHGTNPGSQLREYTKKPTKPSDPTAAHCLFLGWYTDANYTTPFDFNRGMDADVVAHARWVELGNFEFDKFDENFNSTTPQGNGTLANATFNVINNNGRAVYVKTNGTGAYTTIANGGVCFQVKTDANGHFESAADALEKGNYILREVTPPIGYQSIGDVSFSVPWAGA